MIPDIIYNNVINHCRELKMKSEFITKDHFCPICRKEFNMGDNMILILNDLQLFHNSLIHADCFCKEKPENTIGALLKDYEQAKIKVEEIKPWFDIDFLNRRINELKKEIYWKKRADEDE
jgi:hypothetical protein